MDRITVNGKNFRINHKYEIIVDRIVKLAKDIEKDHSEDPTNLILIGVLNGSYMFMSELTKNINLLCKINFLKVASYSHLESTGNVTDLIGLNDDISGKDICIVEDIVDTGVTMKHLFDLLKKKNPRSIKIISLFNKVKKNDIEIDYCGFEIGNDFIIGFGLDFDGYGRNLKDVYILDEKP